MEKVKLNDITEYQAKTLISKYCLQDIPLFLKIDYIHRKLKYISFKSNEEIPLNIQKPVIDSLKVLFTDFKSEIYNIYFNNIKTPYDL